MADYIDITEPRIQSVSFSPDPARAGQAVTILAVIEEIVTKRLYPLPFAAGEISAGEG